MRAIFKLSIILYILFLTWILPAFTNAQSLQITNGLNYLTTTQNPDGSWGDTTTSINTAFYSTAISVETLKILKETNTQTYLNAIQLLNNYSVDNAGYIVWKILALSGENIDLSADLNLLLQWQDEDGGWGGYLEFTGSIFHTAFALQALKAANYSDQNVISSAINYLLSNQNSDGGFGFSQGDESNVYITALVLQTLSEFKTTYNLQDSINKSAAYLPAHQNPDGGFGSSPSTVYETALSLIALIDSGAEQALPLQNAINYITATQQVNGSWDEDPYSTALALRALANVKPNLSVTSNDITFSNPAPTVGDTITITAAIKNTGPSQAENIVVQFYDGSPSSGGILIGETTLSAIPAYGSSTATISWTIPEASTKVVFIAIDPSNTVDELKESDNIASRNLTSATLPDLSITPADITFSPSAPMPGDAVTITVIARNKGETGAENVTLDIYDGNPASDGVRIGNTTFSSIGPGGSATFHLTTNFGVGSHNIYAVADKDNSVLEGAETNNTAAKTLQVGYGFIDLTVMYNDITFSPASPVEGNIVTINASVHNEGEAETGNVLVRFYLGDPDSGGTQIGSDVTIPIISARGIANANTTWNSTGHPGNNEIYVQVDPLDSIFEISEFNNKTSAIVKVAAETGPDLTVTATDINFTPQAPVAGDTVTITANIKNIGTADASNALVEFSLGDPNEGGTLILGSQTIPFIAKGSSAKTQMTWNTAGLTGSYEIYVNNDPFNEIPELIETNNAAHLPITITTPQAADLTIAAIDTTNLITDTQSLTVSGSVRITIENKGNQDTGASFEITAYENRDGINPPTPPFTKGGIIGGVTYTYTLTAGAVDTVDIPVSGNILFRDNLLHVTLDSGNSIQELDETNNTRNTGQECEYIPPVGTFNPALKWSWKKSLIEPYSLNIMMTPAVVDLNKDGIPDVVFGSTASTGGSWVEVGVLRALDGSNGAELFTITDSSLRINTVSSIAVADIDLDGFPEIIACDSTGSRLIAFEHDGTFKWRSQSLEGIYGGAPSIADIDGDGKPEIIIGRQVLDNSGTLLWTGSGGRGSLGLGPLSLAADVNLGGNPEIVAGNTVYDSSGAKLWQAGVQDGYDAIGNFDDDPYPEIVLVGGGGVVYLFEHTGQKKWGPVYMPGGGGGPPTVADFDGDGKPEIGVAGASRYVVFKSDGSILWQSVTRDYSSAVTGSSVFDFDGDGSAEVVYRDELYLRVYRGKDGYVLFQTPMSSCTWHEYVLVADVDADNNAEIVAVANNNCGLGTQRGVYVFGDASDNWVNTRKIWNQHTYHITNVNDDGTIPRYEQNNWEIYNNYRCNSLLPEEVLGTADITASYITVDQTNYPTSVTLAARIGNGGAVSQMAGVDVSLYDGDPSQGGILVGTVKTTRVLEAGDYEDTNVTWNKSTSGNHNIFVVADKDNKFNECREYNNNVSASFDIGVVWPPIQYTPDLEVSPSDITIIPPDPIEGQTAQIKAIIHNVGNLGASDVTISFYDGDPQSGGEIINSATKSYIDSGATALAEVTWSTFGQSGRNYIHVMVDPQNIITESNENNNATLIPVEIIPPTKPDLATASSEMTFSNLNPAEGELLIINANIHNLGTETGDIAVFLYDGDPSGGGALMAQKTIAQLIPFGEQTTISFEVDTLGLAGENRFYIVVDPANAIDEINETNNTAWNSLTIGASGLNLDIATDKTIYTANENVQITLPIENLMNAQRTGTLQVKIIDLYSNLVATISSETMTLAPYENKTLNYTWNTGGTLAGNYKVYGHVIEGGSIRAKTETPIGISPVQAITSKVFADKVSYSVHEPVTITSTIQSASPNYIFENLTAKIDVGNQQSAIYTETQNIPILLPDQIVEFKTYWNTGANPSGTYPVTLEVKDASGNILSASTTNLTISSDIKPSRLLRGQISVDKQSLLQGEPVNIAYTVTNIGNTNLSDIDLSILTVHVVNTTVYDTLTDHTGLLMAESYANTQQLDTTNYNAKDYLVILRAAIEGVKETLASSYFRVEGAPSAPSLHSPKQGEDIETLSPLLTVNNASDPNDDELTYEFELYSDSGLSNLIASSGLIAEGTNITSWQVPLELQENAVYYWRARAYDGLLYGEWMMLASFRVNVTNEPPSAPTLSSPADNSAVDTLTPHLIVNNAFDPDSSNLTYNFDLSLDPDFIQVVASEIGIFEGIGTTLWQVPVSLNENTYYYWRSQADDWFTTGPWMMTARFFVNTANDAPTAPVIILPVNGSEIATVSADIAVSNSTDPDSMNLTYVFELDTVNSFDSPSIRRSGNIPEGVGATSWFVDNLSDNTYYFVRAKASDGLAESPWSEVTGFFVNTGNDAPTAPVLSNPSDGSGVNTFNPMFSVHNSFDIDGDALTYEFEIYGDPAMTTLVSSAAGITESLQITSWTVAVVLTENQTYYWRARAYDGELYSGWMPLASVVVNTANDAPSAPTLHSPVDGSSLDTLYPPLSVYNASDPDSDILTYDFEIYDGVTLIRSMQGIPQNNAGITSVTLDTALSDNTTYTWRARAYDGDCYGAWMDMATFSIHLPVMNITATIDFDPNTLNKKSNGTWVVVYIEMPQDYSVNDVDRTSILLNDIVPAEPWPYAIGDHDRDGIPDLMVKFRRDAVINILPNGDNVVVFVRGTVGATTFEGFDTIRVIHE